MKQFIPGKLYKINHNNIFYFLETDENGIVETKDPRKVTFVGVPKMTLLCLLKIKMKY